MQLSRRDVLKVLGASGVCVYLSGCGRWFKPWGANDVLAIPPEMAGVSPISRDELPLFSTVFSGDQPQRAHDVLWDKAAFLASRGSKLPPPLEKVSVVVVGGGIGGLLSAYLLRKHQPVVLEQAQRFGGNAKGESWDGLDYAIGAAYVCEPGEGSRLESLMREIGVFDLAQRNTLENPVEIQGKLNLGFWQGKSAPQAAANFKKLHRYFLDVYHERNGQIFPDLPFPENESKTSALVQSVFEKDRISFRTLLEQVVQGPLHPHLASLIENYCWSAFGGSADEVSGASGLNFFSAEFGPLLICPGGNAAIAQQVLQKLVAVLPRSHLRTRAIVFDIQVRSDGVQIAYLDAEDRIRVLFAKTVVLACPKFVVAKLIPDLEPERQAAIARLKYRSYVVANVLVKGVISPSFYDLFLLGAAQGWRRPVANEVLQSGAQDVILATLASPQSQNTVLTLYKPLPYEGARERLYRPDAFDTFRKQFETQIGEVILPLLGIERQRWVGLRMARWGHPIPLAEPGLIVRGTVDQLRKPFKNRVFFVSQDNWCLPSFETVASEALTNVTGIKRCLPTLGQNPK